MELEVADGPIGLTAPRRTPATRFAVASGNTALTSLVVMQLVDDDRPTLSTPAAKCSDRSPADRRRR